jgi:hypothetical protein
MQISVKGNGKNTWKMLQFKEWSFFNGDKKRKPQYNEVALIAILWHWLAVAREINYVNFLSCLISWRKLNN